MEWIVGSENPGGADNQQESLSSEEQRFWFLAGLVEGEGSVHLSVKKHPTARFGVYIQPEFFLYQHKSRIKLLEMAQEFFGAGRIRPKPGNPDVLVYSIHSRKTIALAVRSRSCR
jgi:LAGLIDADG endonuclease